MKKNYSFICLLFFTLLSAEHLYAQENPVTEDSSVNININLNQLASDDEQEEDVIVIVIRI